MPDFLQPFRDQLQALLQVALAMLFGGLIGLEREFQDKPAGLRTHMLVAGASALITILGIVLVRQLAKELGSNIVDTDPLRIIGAVVTGISFLGAGTIMRRSQEREVEGLTTAASLLATAGVGVSLAMAQWVLAVGATVLALVVLQLVDVIERWMQQKWGNRG